jgi:hypothetical protein
MAQYRLYATISVLVSDTDETPDAATDALREGIIDALPAILSDTGIGSASVKVYLAEICDEHDTTGIPH